MNTDWIKRLVNNGYNVEFRQSREFEYTELVVWNTETDKHIGLTVSFDFLSGSAIDMIEFVKQEWQKEHGKAPLLYEYK